MFVGDVSALFLNLIEQSISTLSVRNPKPEGYQWLNAFYKVHGKVGRLHAEFGQ